MPHKDTLLLRISFNSAQSIPCSNDADMAGTIQAPEGCHGVETNMFVPQSPQGEEDSRPGRNCSGFEDTQDLETAVCPPLLPMAPCGSQVLRGRAPVIPSAPPMTLNKITCILAEVIFCSFHIDVIFCLLLSVLEVILPPP